jgi:hypothetical protein
MDLMHSRLTPKSVSKFQRAKVRRFTSSCVPPFGEYPILKVLTLKD